jgi:hypothetical protein
VRKIHRELEVPLAWQWVETIRQAVVQELAGYDQELRDAAEMVASELAENVVRYGRPVDGDSSGLLVLTVDDGVVRISSRNGVTPAQAKPLLEIIEGIKAGNAEELALTRLRNMIDSPEQEGSQLGLLRIAYEGQFSIDAEVAEDGVLVVTAWRSIQ